MKYTVSAHTGHIHNKHMKVSISNIAWNAKCMNDRLDLISSHGIDGLELSPSMIWSDPVSASNVDIFKLKELVNSYGIQICSMHSLTYPRPDLKIFSSQLKREELIEYICKLGNLASMLECPYMVYGSGSSRNIGGLDKDKAYSLLTETFCKISKRLEDYNVVLLIEYLSPKYTDCINSADEAAKLVSDVNQDAFQLHVDLRTSFEIGEDIAHVWSKYGSIVRHCHVGNPDLKPPSKECLQHNIASRAMNKSNYRGYVSIEMKREYCPAPTDISSAIDFVKDVYLNEHYIQQ